MKGTPAACAKEAGRLRRAPRDGAHHHRRPRSVPEPGDTTLAHVLRHVGGALLFVTVLVASFLAGHFVSAWGLGLLGLTPSLLSRLSLTALVGLFLLAVPLGVIATIERDRHTEPFNSLIAAIQRIAQGDFGARASVPISEEHPIGRLVSSINDMASELEATDRLRREFVSNVSHELRSPLTSIQGFAHMLEDADLPEEERGKALAVIQSEARRLAALSDNLLRLTALDALGQATAPKRRPLHLGAQVQKALLASEPRWSAKEIEVEARLEDVVVRGDEALLDLVWSNLIDNAIKFTPSGGRITVSVRSEGIRAVIGVSDTGLGIAMDDQERIFERFFKADRSRDRTLEGSGLGLALAKEIVDLHGGVVALESALGMGSTFTVCLPLDGGTVGMDG